MAIAKVAPRIVSPPLDLDLVTRVFAPYGPLLSRDREVQVICRSAQRAYYATRILLQNGFKATSISGGMLSRAMRSLIPAGPLPLPGARQPRPPESAGKTP